MFLMDNWNINKDMILKYFKGLKFRLSERLAQTFWLFMALDKMNRKLYSVLLFDLNRHGC